MLHFAGKINEFSGIASFHQFKIFALIIKNASTSQQWPGSSNPSKEGMAGNNISENQVVRMIIFKAQNVC